MALPRRRFLQITGALAAGIVRVGRSPVLASQDRQLPLVLRGGRLWRDGAWRVQDVGVDDSGRLRFGELPLAAEAIDVSGRVVTAGFIDLLADNGSRPAVTFPIFEKYKVSDGVTTALQMHGGSADCAGYYSLLGRRPHLINFGVSTFVMGIRYKVQDAAARRRLVERNLEQGALGVSHSLEYQPTPYEEVLEYAKLAAKYDRPMFLHLRYSSREQELDGVDEAIRLARESGARVHIGHLHSTGGTFHMEAALARIRSAIGEGLRLTTCVYPYSYWATYLASRRFDPGWQERYGLGFGDLRLVGSGERLTAGSFARYRKTAVLVAVPEGAMPLATTFDLALREPFCMVGSDGGIQGEPRANSHPRGAGCFATAIRHALDIGMPLEQILPKLTALPGSMVRPALGARGTLEEGAVADLTVFDPQTIRGNATVENPNQFSSGIDLVLVNGKAAWRGGKPADRCGVAIRN